MPNQLYLDASFRVSIRLTTEEYNYLVESGMVRINDNGDVDVEDYAALTHWVDCNRSEDDCYIENVEIGE
jgi:hypothetical protein